MLRKAVEYVGGNPKEGRMEGIEVIGFLTGIIPVVPSEAEIACISCLSEGDSCRRG